MSRKSSAKPDSSDSAPVLLYDGHCALCNGWVRFLLRVDHHGPLRFAALSSRYGQALLAAHPEVAVPASIVLIEGDRITARSTAVLRIFRYLGKGWKLLLIGYLIPREIRDSLYNVVAHWRYRLFGRYDRCPLPPAGAGHRFLS
ncbi:MAG: thiol-disulfide oxidoreductase DCC family protein [Gemmatimonadales bacterium]